MLKQYRTKLKMRILFSFTFAVLLSFTGLASHLVGGEMDYECLGNNQYRIHLRIYRDCNSTGAAFDQPAKITIFNSSGSVLQNLSVNHGAATQLPATVDNPCLQSPPNICTHYTDYYTTVTLPPIQGGYTITYQRCCRNPTISNIPNPGDWGNTYTVTIPSNDTGCNTSPSFKSPPPIILCLNDPLHIDASVNEPDGDSIYYELCSPLHGGGTTTNPSTCGTCVAPSPATAPPYTPVPFIAGRTPTNPIPSSPAITIDPNTGLITGTPNQVGQFVFAICVSEYGNGQLKSTVRRDYQFNVTNCSSNVRSGIKSQIDIPGSICAGRTISFTELAINAATYSWDFGDPTTSADTSNQPNPSYTYSDTGTYTVSLIVNKGTPCSDTATATFSIHYPVNFTVQRTGNACFDLQNFIYSANGSFSPDATYDWTFPAQANIQQFSGPSPPAINFNQTGTFWVELTVTDFGCTSTYGDSITVTSRPTFSGDSLNTTVCAPYALDLNHSSNSVETVYYEWVFGDGTTSNLENPSKVYTRVGVYSGYLLMYTKVGCIDSAQYNFTIEVYPSADVSISINPTKTDIFYPYVNVSVGDVDPNEQFTIEMGDGSTYQNRKQFRHKYSDTGWYEIRLLSVNEYGCGNDEIHLFRVAPIPLLYTPDAFSPNGDGENDRFRSFSSGYSQFRLDIFDRWGNLLFSSNDAQEWWDGTDRNTGDPMPQGTYVWVVHFRSTEGEFQERRGTVTLLR